MEVPIIDSFQFGRIVINGEVHKKDVIILPSHIIGNWWRQSGHLLQLSDLQDVMLAQPELLIIGQGANRRMQVDSDVTKALSAAGIEMISLDTSNACIEYNKRSKTGKVAAALHLTC